MTLDVKCEKKGEFKHDFKEFFGVYQKYQLLLTEIMKADNIGYLSENNKNSC